MGDMVHNYGIFLAWVKVQQEKGNAKIPDGKPPRADGSAFSDINFILRDAKWSAAYLEWAVGAGQYKNLEFLQMVEVFQRSPTWELADKIKKDFLDTEEINLYEPVMKDIKDRIEKRLG
jgi:hypothetical protein